MFEQSVEYNSLMIRQYVGGGKGLYDPKFEGGVWLDVGRGDAEEMRRIVTDALDANKPSPVIVAIEPDESEEFYNLLLGFPPGSRDMPFYERVRVPLIEFCEMLAEEYRKREADVSLCFVADASCGLGTELVSSLMKDSTISLSVIRDASWMTSVVLAILSSRHRHRSMTTEEISTIIYALCHLDARRVKKLTGKEQILFTVPQACVPLLLGYIQRVFVAHKLVFVIDECARAVETGISLRRKYGNSYRIQARSEEWGEVSSSPLVISATRPATPVRCPPELAASLSKLSGLHAGIVESWMASASAARRIIKSNGKDSDRAPYICKVKDLIRESNNGEFRLHATELTKLVQHITGTETTNVTIASMPIRAQGHLEERAKRLIHECERIISSSIDKID